MPVADFVTRVQGFQYDGSNGEEIALWVDGILDQWGADPIGYVMESWNESGGVLHLVMSIPGANIDVPLNDWVLYSPIGFSVNANQYFPLYWLPVAPTA